MEFRMALFKRRINKEAASRPRGAKDYCTGSSTLYGGLDATSFSNIDRIASEVAGLNYAIYDRESKQKVKNHSLYPVLKEPSLDERHFNFFYQSTRDYFNGGVFWLVRRYQGEVVSLFRLNPKDVKVQRNSYSRRREFVHAGVTYTDRDVVYIPARFDYSTLSGSRSLFESIPSVFKTSEKLDKYAQKSFDNGIGKRLIVDITGYGDLTDEQVTELKANFNAEYSGVENATKSLFKRKGVEYSEIGSNGDNRAAELAENRKLQREIVDEVFQMPKDQNDIERYFTMLNEFAIKPIALQFQEAINSLLDEDYYYFEFDYNGLMKVSLTQRIDALNKQIQGGQLSLNEARALENRTPVEAGDTFFMPVNMMPWNEETKQAYMAKQKQIANGGSNPLDPDTQHIPQGDDKQ